VEGRRVDRHDRVPGEDDRDRRGDEDLIVPDAVRRAVVDPVVVVVDEELAGVEHAVLVGVQENLGRLIDERLAGIELTVAVQVGEALLTRGDRHDDNTAIGRDRKLRDEIGGSREAVGTDSLRADPAPPGEEAYRTPDRYRIPEL